MVDLSFRFVSVVDDSVLVFEQSSARQKSLEKWRVLLRSEIVEVFPVVSESLIINWMSLSAAFILTRVLVISLLISQQMMHDLFLVWTASKGILNARTAASNI